MLIVFQWLKLLRRPYKAAKEAREVHVPQTTPKPSPSHPDWRRRIPRYGWMGTTDMRNQPFLDNFTSGSSASRSDLLKLPNKYRTAHTRNLRFLWFLTRKALGTRSCLAKHFLGLGPRDVQGCFRFRYCVQSGALNHFLFNVRIVRNVYGHLRKSSDNFGYVRFVFGNPSTLRLKISRFWLRKSWQVYHFGEMSVIFPHSTKWCC